MIGGYVGSYKTLLGINMMYNNAIYLKYNVCFFSLEMYEKEIYRRLAVRHARNPSFNKYNQKITMDKLNAEGGFSENEEEFFYNNVVRDLKKNRQYGSITIVDSLAMGGNTIEGILYCIDADLKGKDGKGGGLHLVIIDYIQLYAQYYEGDRFSATAKVARDLKNLALTFAGRGITVVALSQLSRAAFMSARESIKKSHESDPYQYIYSITSFAESSEIERASDACITIFSDDKLKEKGKAVMQLIKNRNGRTIDKGFEVMVAPDTSYIGDPIEEADKEARNAAVGVLLEDVALL